MPSEPTLASEAQKFENLRSLLTGLAVLAVAVFIVWGGATLASETTEKEVQREYVSLSDVAGRGSFAKRHMNNPLGGLILLQQANEYYTSGNYAAARTAYSEVVSSGLKLQPVLAEQALLGEAFSSYELDPSRGLAELKKIAENNSLMQSTRAYAATELAGYYAQNKDFKQAKDYFQLINTLAYAKSWQRQASLIARQYPELGTQK